jgi:hypothetical protein
MMDVLIRTCHPAAENEVLTWTTTYLVAEEIMRQRALAAQQWRSIILFNESGKSNWWQRQKVTRAVGWDDNIMQVKLHP